MNTGGFRNWEEMDPLLGDKRFTELRKKSGELPSATSFNRAFVGNVTLPVEDIANFVSLSLPTRRVCTSRVRELQRSVSGAGVTRKHQAQLTEKVKCVSLAIDASAHDERKVESRITYVPHSLPPRRGETKKNAPFLLQIMYF